MHKNLKKLPPLDLVRQQYRYDPSTGEVWHRCRHWNKRTKQSEWTNTWRRHRSHAAVQGYGQYHLHRIAWLLHYGEDPFPWIIDHINRNHEDNRICNLRKVTPAENCANRDPYYVAHVQSRKSVRITYPDGRGSIVTDSLNTAARLLGRKATSIKRTIEAGGKLCWGKGRWSTDSGIRVAWYTEHT